MLKLYVDMMSQPSRALFLFMKKTQIPFERCIVDIKSGAHKTDEYKQVHPFQQVPAIDDKGFKLFESVGILRYLCREYSDKVDDHWYPKDSKRQAKIDEYMEWQHANTRFHCAMFFQHRFLIPMLTGSAPKQSSIDRFQAGTERVLNDLEEYWLKDRQFIAGDEVSIADILAITELQQLEVIDYDITTDHPKLSKWLVDVKEALNPELTETNTILQKVKAMNLKRNSKL